MTDEELKRATDELVAAAREVDRLFYEEDSMWVVVTKEERAQADDAVIALHDKLVALDASISEDRVADPG